MTQLPPWTSHQFEQYVQIATAKMVQEGVLNTRNGVQPRFHHNQATNGVQPRFHHNQATRTDRGGWSIGLTVDLSPIGLPIATTMSAFTQPDGSVSWSLGEALIRSLPGEWTPEEAGEGLSKHMLRAAYRRSIEPGRSDGRAR